jgi:hypothetical protein
MARQEAGAQQVAAISCTLSLSPVFVVPMSGVKQNSCLVAALTDNTAGLGTVLSANNIGMRRQLPSGRYMLPVNILKKPSVDPFGQTDHVHLPGLASHGTAT